MAKLPSVYKRAGSPLYWGSLMINGNRELFFSCILRAVKWLGVSKVSRQIGLSRVCIYDTLDGANANPSLDTLSRILGVFGVRISFELAPEARPKSCAANYLGA